MLSIRILILASFSLGKLFARNNLTSTGLYSRSSSIVNGYDSPYRSFYVSVAVYDRRGKRYQCGGSIIGSRTVITAAHCIKPGNCICSPFYFLPVCNLNFSSICLKKLWLFSTPPHAKRFWLFSGFPPFQFGLPFILKKKVVQKLFTQHFAYQKCCKNLFTC